MDARISLCRHAAFLQGAEFSEAESIRICLDENGCSRRLDEIAILWSAWRMLNIPFIRLDSRSADDLWKEASFFDNIGKYGSKKLLVPELPYWDGKASPISAAAAVMDALIMQKRNDPAFRTFLYVLPNMILEKGDYEFMFPSAGSWNDFLLGKMNGRALISGVSE